MMNSVAPFWDGNETWLVLGGGGLLGRLPEGLCGDHAGVLSAGHRHAARAHLPRRLASSSAGWPSRTMLCWDVAFAGGSIVAAFSQGVILGGLHPGHHAWRTARFAGGPFDWATPFALLCGLGLVAGYALLGATWLIAKTEGGTLAEQARRWAPGCSRRARLHGRGQPVDAARLSSASPTAGSRSPTSSSSPRYRSSPRRSPVAPGGRSPSAPRCRPSSPRSASSCSAISASPSRPFPIWCRRRSPSGTPPRRPRARSSR